MKSCEEINRLVTPYVDGETDTQTSTDIEAHLAACSPCHAVADKERVARTAVRAWRSELGAAAPQALHRRCAEARPHAPMRGSRPLLQRPWVPVAAAGSVVLVAGAVGLFVLSARLDAALAAQLTIDHFKCFASAPAGSEGINAEEAAAGLNARYGWAIPVPPSDRSRGLALIEARRCLYLDGALAHLLYRHEGQAVSVFVIPEGSLRQERVLEVLGHDAIIWSDGGRTYAVIGREGPAGIRTIAAHVRAAAGG